VREIYGKISQRLRDGVPFVAATLIATRGAKASAIGTTLIVDSDGSFSGDIGAGCNEGEIIELATAMLAEGRHERSVLAFHVDDQVFVGSGCGARLDVALWRPEADFALTARAIALGNEDVRFMLEGVEIDVPAKPWLAIVGATSLAAELTLIAQRADFRVAVVDPRPAFATRARHPHADKLIVAWPDDLLSQSYVLGASAIVILSHDVKLDMPALRAALATRARYIGLLGNRHVQAARRITLLEEGFDDEQIERICGPTGLDVGGTTDGQTALSILAEILAQRHHRSALPLSKIKGAIHP
jgi:xanthine dehydrogenase accessory factor